MLQLTGKVLGVTSETREGPTGSFISQDIHLLDGLDKTVVRVGRDFPQSSLPKEGDTVTLDVVASAFARRSGGAGLQLTALAISARPGARVAAAV